MKTEDERYILIDNYLRNKLSEDQITIVEKLIKSDPGFREEVYYHQIALDLIIENRYKEISKSFKEINIQQSFWKSVIGKTTAIGITLTISCCLLLFYFLKNKSSETKDTKKLPNQTLDSITNGSISDSSVLQDSNNSSDINPFKETNHLVSIKNKDSISTHKNSFVIAIPFNDSLEADPLNTSSKYTLKLGDKWECPSTENTSFILKIINNKGEEVFNRRSNGVKLYWNGKDSLHQNFPSGNYTFVVDYGNGIIDKGYINLYE